jgi:adenine-specific DNA-methyltransferase
MTNIIINNSIIKIILTLSIVFNIITMSEYNVEDLGQVFTPEDIVERMCKMIKNGSRILEPSCGDGIFLNNLSNENIVGIEFDQNHCPENAICMDFFDYSIDEKFDTIVGNPPYVKGKKILKQTLSKINSKCVTHAKSNLYLYFIEKSINHLTDNGEIIFITPREFIKSTSSIGLNQFIYDMGTITDWYEFGDSVVFKGYSPSVVIFRFQKGDFSRKTITNSGVKTFTLLNGQILFLDDAPSGTRLGDLFDVKVGGVSGMDEVFAEETGNEQFVCSYTAQTGQLKTFHYNIINDYITSKKDVIIKRKIKKFNETNWWMWGRDFYKSDRRRIYVNAKTRNQNPFFTHECKNYDGSVLALIPKSDEVENNIDFYLSKLNLTDWKSLGFKVGGRFVFSQKTLSNITIDV